MEQNKILEDEVNEKNLQEEERLDIETERKEKKPWSKKKKFGVVVLVCVVILFWIFGGDTKSPVETVEANNICGLSTTVTVDEFIYYYNEALSESGEVESDSPFFEIAGGLVKENLTITHESGVGAVKYFWRQPLGSRDMQLTFWADAENNCIIQTQAIFNYEEASNKYGSHDPENAVNARMAMIENMLYAVCKGDKDAANELNELLQDYIENEEIQWNDGIVVMGGQISGNEEYMGAEFFTMTEEYFEQMFNQEG